MKQIYIIPYAGLCNRMRAIASGLQLATRNHCPATIYWNNCDGLRADFNELFLPITLPNVTIKENRQWLFRIGHKKDYLLRWPLLNSRYYVVFNYSSHTHGDITPMIEAKDINRLMLISCYSMCTHLKMSELFVPVPAIQNKIDAITQNFTNETIGVQIRRTDNAQSIKRSPIEAFIRIIKEEIEKSPTVNFFLATDDQQVKELLSAMFPNRFITMSAAADRESLGGMQNAVVDLFALSKAQKVIGSDYSSFSQIAAELGEIELVTARP